jgi:osmotically inducible lipoprotein OsmB
MENRRMLKLPALLLSVVLSLSACAGMTDTQRRASTGTVAGAAGGAAIGAMAGNAGMGAAIGAGVGLLGGLVYDQNRRAYEQGRQDGQAGR